MLQSSVIFQHSLPSNLKELYLEYNKLTWVPSKFPESLEILSLANNSITEFTSEISGKLKTLNLNNNRIRTFSPSWTVRYKQLDLFIQDNCILYDLTEVVLYPTYITIYQIYNWNEYFHTYYAYLIQRYFKNYSIRKGIRHWARLSKMYNELLEVAMSPDIVGRFDQIETWDSWNHT
jgi:Leucine-rich repeat (LRR) protein